MSGGHYDYAFYKIDSLIEEIEKDFVDGGYYYASDEVNDFLSRNKENFDRLDGLNETQRILFLEKVNILLKDLKSCSKRAKELEYFLSGDCGHEDFIKLD